MNTQVGKTIFILVTLWHITFSNFGFKSHSSPEKVLKGTDGLRRNIFSGDMFGPASDNTPKIFTATLLHGTGSVKVPKERGQKDLLIDSFKGGSCR